MLILVLSSAIWWMEETGKHTHGGLSHETPRGELPEETAEAGALKCKRKCLKRRQVRQVNK